MKTLLSVCLLMIGVAVQTYAQDVLPLVNNRVEYTNIIDAPDLKASTLYSNALKWFAKYYVDSKDVIQFSDKDDGQIIGKGSFKVNYFSRNPIINYTITISIKDGKFKYNITYFSYSDIQGDSFNIEEFPSTWGAKKSLYRKINNEVNNIVSSLKVGMIATPNNNW